MFHSHWQSLRSFFGVTHKKSGTVQRPKTILRVEQLEDRCVPSATPTLDLTTAGAIGEINHVIFRQLDQQPAGSGVIHSFVRLDSPGNSTTEQGFNTDARPLQFDENNSPVFTRSLALSSVPTITIDRVVYREFLLDINQKSSQPLLSLDELRFFAGAAPNLSGYDTGSNTLGGLPAAYDLGAGNWIELNARLSHGSGQSDMAAYVPDSVFAGQSYVYLYSKFGVNVSANGGYEEWATTSTVAANTGVISGYVDTTAGTPIAGVTVTIFIDLNNNDQVNNNEVFFTTTTDSNGFYSFTGLFTGVTYTEIVSKPANTSTTTYTGTPSPLDVTLTSGTPDVMNVDFSFQATTVTRV